MAAQKAGKRNEVALAKLDLQKRQEMRKFAREQKILDAGKWALWICATWVPLRVADDMVQSLAGKDTEVSAGLSISLTYAAVATFGWVVMGVKSRSRQKEILRLRAKVGKFGVDLDMKSSQKDDSEVSGQ